MIRLKVRRSDSLETHGIAARSLDQCIEKGCKHLQIDKRKEFGHISLATDNTKIQDADYFATLDKDTLLIFHLKPGKSTGSPVDAIVSLLSKIRMKKCDADELLKAAEFLEDNQLKSIVCEIVSKTNENTGAESREEDADWFKNVTDKKVKTKSEVMESSAMNRVRGYFSEAKKVLKDEEFTTAQRKLADSILKEWHAMLKEESMFKHYFSRRNQKESITFCNADGLFNCEGSYACDRCMYFSHTINPYASAEQRVIFSTWNLDHQIEKARTVLPKVVELIKSNRSAKVNWSYFFDLMFTRQNLKLVHIACHDKKQHTEAKIDMKAAFTRR